MIFNPLVYRILLLICDLIKDRILPFEKVHVEAVNIILTLVNGSHLSCIEDLND